MKEIGYAIVGTGYFGAELGRIMKEQDFARIVAVYDPENADKMSLYGFRHILSVHAQ